MPGPGESSLSPRGTEKLKGGGSEIELSYKTVRSTDLLTAGQSTAGLGSIQALNEAKTANANNRFQIANKDGKRSGANKVTGKPARLRKSVKPDNVLLGHQSSERKLWLFLVTILTGWLPNWVLRLGGVRGQDVIQAWREKFALCLIVLISSVLAIGWLEVSSSLLCPSVANTYNYDSVKASQNLVIANGKVLDITRSTTNIGRVLKKYVGKDVSTLFPAFARLGHPSDNSTTYSDTTIAACIADPSVADNWLFARIVNDWSRTYNLTSSGRLIGCPAPGGAPGAVETCFYSDPAWRDFSRMVVGDLLLDQDSLYRTFNQTTKPNYAVILSKAYDVTQYLRHAIMYSTDDVNSANFATVPISPRSRYMFLPLNVTLPLARAAGADVSSSFNQASSPTYTRCLDKLFYAGRVTPPIFRTICGFGNPLLLAFSGCIYSIVVIKFLVSLLFQFNVRPAMMNAYCLCFVPCYTEGYTMRVTLETLAACDYPDDRKLIVVVCDGNIKGKGNPLPTPQIVLDILGWKGEEPEPQFYHALGKGSDKINMCKAYSGWYEFNKHRVPFIVIAKVGKPDEAKKPKPGNRGKRDSQLILMNYFNKLLMHRELSPFEYDLYYHMKHVIGVAPQSYEYCLMVDADTEVEPDSMNELVAAMVNDQRKIGVCGETQVSNKWTSWVTMIQVHEAFESMFGSVTCLPGCFSMYRVCNAKGEAFLVNDVIIEDYRINKVSTLHSKNLLHLGEDRYLTTLLLKHFPNNRLEFIPSAVCHTDIPDSFDVLLSQRRRWINSTFHNLYEVMKLPRLCSVCFISMKTLVFMDLLSTLVLPAATIYLYIIVIRAIIGGIEQYAVVLIGAAGLYITHLIIILLVTRKYEYVLWITVYIILAMPVFSIILPLYSFWHQDDFSWGATRLIEGGDDGHHEGEANGQIKNIEVKLIADYEAADVRLRERRTSSPAGPAPGTQVTVPTSPVVMVGGHVVGQMMFAMPMSPAGGPMSPQGAPAGFVMYQPMVMGPNGVPMAAMPMGMAPQQQYVGQPQQQYPAQMQQQQMVDPHTGTVRAAPMVAPDAGYGQQQMQQSQPQQPYYDQNYQQQQQPPVQQQQVPDVRRPSYEQGLAVSTAIPPPPAINYPQQGLAPAGNTIAGTVGAAFEQLYRDLQLNDGITDSNNTGYPTDSNMNHGGPANGMYDTYQGPPPPQQQFYDQAPAPVQPQQYYDQSTVPAQQQQYYDQAPAPAQPQQYYDQTPAQTGYASPPLQQPSMGYATQQLSAPGMGATMFGGNTVGAAFAEAFKALQDDQQQ
ncbi:hypothetical protein H9P43_003617 [Blastocladiella emersonii ATCC 22665]|nr:hypothetical protein H9P43_003617 [Blastocladiella emersonii ATCC 22665]